MNICIYTYIHLYIYRERYVCIYGLLHICLSAFPEEPASANQRRKSPVAVRVLVAVRQYYMHTRARVRVRTHARTHAHTHTSTHFMNKTYVYTHYCIHIYILFIASVARQKSPAGSDSPDISSIHARYL